MCVSVYCEKDIIIASMKGDIDHFTTSEIRPKLSDFVKRSGKTKLIMDFTNVIFMDSSGIGMIIGRYKEMDILNGETIIVSGNKTVEKILRLAGIYRIIKIFPDIDSGKRYFTEGE